MTLPLNFMTIRVLDKQFNMPSVRNGLLNSALPRAHSGNGVSVTDSPIFGSVLSPPVDAAIPVSSISSQHMA